MEDYRAEKKDQLQRTFCSASAAAKSKVNRSSGDKRPAEDDESTSQPKKEFNFVKFEVSSDKVEDKKIEGFILPPKKAKMSTNEVEDKKIEGFILPFETEVFTASAKTNNNETGDEVSMEALEMEEGNQLLTSEVISPKQKIALPETDHVLGGKMLEKVEELEAENLDLKASVVDLTNENTTLKERLEALENEKASRDAKDDSSVKQIDHDLQEIQADLDHLQPDISLPLHQSLHNFIIVESEGGKSAADTLSRSAKMNKRNLRFEFNKELSGVKKNVCIVKIDGHQVSVGVGVSRKGSKENGCVKALEKLRSYCYTIIKKNQPEDQVFSHCTNVDPKDLDAMDVEVKVDEGNKVGDEATALQDNNVGHKMLRLMGWSGGGLGKNINQSDAPIFTNIKQL